MLDFYKACRKYKFDIVHGYVSTLNIFPLFAAKMAKIPVRISESISMAHEGDWKTYIKKLLRPLSSLFATHYMSCGEDCGRWQFGNKMFDEGKIDVFKTVINTSFNAYNPELRDLTRKKYGWENNLVVGHIGRFTQQKNPLFMIDIFAAVLKREPRAVLCLIGDGVLKNQMMERIRMLGIDDKVNYLGPREDIQQFYNAMDCFLLPSLYEGLPVVGLEAESCGLPMFFSTEVTREANACELGHFISLEESADRWAEEIIKAMEKNVKKRRSYAKEVADAGFDSETEAKRLQNYYLTALRKKTKHDK